jgi:hypothetical protein
MERWNERFKYVLHKYKEETRLHEHTWPEKFKFEEIRIKRYRMGRGNFLDHVDVGSLDSAMRFLVLFVYLNNDKYILGSYLHYV